VTLPGLPKKKKTKQNSHIQIFRQNSHIQIFSYLLCFFKPTHQNGSTHQSNCCSNARRAASQPASPSGGGQVGRM